MKMGGRHIRERKSMKDRNDAIIIYESRGETTGGKKGEKDSLGDRGIRGESRVERHQLEQKEHENFTTYSESNKVSGKSKRNM